MSEYVLKTLACRGLRVGPSKLYGTFPPPPPPKLHDTFCPPISRFPNIYSVYFFQFGRRQKICVFLLAAFPWQGRGDSDRKLGFSIQFTIRSGKTDPVQFKGFFLNRALFACKKWAFCKQFSPLRYRTFISLKKGKFVFQKSLSETPFKPDGSVFALPILARISIKHSFAYGPHTGVLQVSCRQGKGTQILST